MIKLIKFCNKPKSLHELLEYMNWKDRTKFSRRFILPLIELNMIKRTIPEKPKSSKQKYLMTENGSNALEMIKKKK